MATKRN